MPESDNYQSPPGIAMFHPDYNITPYKAASLLKKAAGMHAKGKRRGKAAPKHAFMPPRVSTGAKVFGGKK